MNKELYAILGVGVAILIGMWMVWSDVRAEIRSVRVEISSFNTRLGNLESRVGRIEGILLERGELAYIAPEENTP